MTSYEIRRVRADEWEQAKQLRLDALRDPVAHLAFLESYDAALARPDAEWRQRTVDAAAGERVCQFVAVADGRLVGGVVVLVTAAGEPDYLGETADRRRAALVGVFVRAEHRGVGLIERLTGAAADWVAGLGIDSVSLFVNERNARAIAAYRRTGFVATGRKVELSDGINLEMVRGVAPRDRRGTSSRR